MSLLLLLAACAQQTLKPDETLDRPDDSVPVETGDTAVPCVPEVCAEGDVTGILDPNTLDSAESATCLLFTSVPPEESGLVETSPLHAGISLVDLNGDGLIDIYLLNYKNPSDDLERPNQMFLNLGGGVFEDVSEATHLNVGGDSRHSLWADYDTDGDLDLLLSGFNGTRLARNDAGVFTFLEAPNGINDSDSVAVATWIGSGFLIATDNGTRFYPYNSGDQFISTDPRQQAEDRGLDDAGTGSAIALADYDGDGDDDIYLSNITGRNRLMKNNGDGTYTSVEVEAKAVEEGNDSSMDVEWVYFGTDTLPSLGVADDDGNSHFYRNQGDGTFVDEAPGYGLQDPGPTRSLSWAYLRSDYPALAFGRYDIENLLYYPLVDEKGNLIRYENIAHAVHVDDLGATLAMKALDYDGDGDQDFVTVMYDGGLFLHRNDTKEVNLCPA